MAGKRTIDDIARLAGVSKATVSRVLNHKPDVDPLTRERILHIMEEEGFVPSITASGLAGGRSRLIGVLVPSFTWPLIPDVMRGVAEVVGLTPYEMVLYSINDSIRDNGSNGDVIDHILATKLTAGILAILPGQSSKHVVRLHKHGFPVVMIDDQELPGELPWIGADNREGAHAAVCHLLHLGHRRIAHIQGPLKHLCSRERYQGYCQALEEAGLRIDPELVLEGDFTPVGGRSAASKLFALPVEQRPTAIFAASDPMAYGVFAAAEEYGLHIPRDIALVGFDDIASSAHVRPALTTVRQPFYEMGQHGIKLLLSMLNGPRVPLRGDTGLNGFLSSYSASSEIGVKENSDPVRIQLPTSLIVRASCGSPHHFSDSAISASGLSF
ncbi:MAG: LacI family DNA-binding transcriptional regulator [Ktedonobacteraceae bacterium]|nr:LacI family DNA-binding transcriptional regulator [Ktedonobacteraceae bacterium]